MDESGLINMEKELHDNDLRQFGELNIRVFESKKNHRGKVKLFIGECEDEFKMLMMSAEFLTHLVAQKSNAGYEKALDLIRKGAMTYKTTNRPDLIDEGQLKKVMPDASKQTAKETGAELIL